MPEGESMSDKEQKKETPETEGSGFPDPRARMKQKIMDEERARQSPEAEVENAGEPEEVVLIHEEEDEPEADDKNQQLLRLMADFDNFRRRTAKEKLLERQRGRREAAEKLLPVFDSLTMGLLTMPADNPVRSGMEAVQQQLLSAFDQLGLKKISTKGEPFDPELHEAIVHMASPEPEGVVCEESRAGFIDDVGLLRAAQVVVSSGPPEEG